MRKVIFLALGCVVMQLSHARSPFEAGAVDALEKIPKGLVGNLAFEARVQVYAVRNEFESAQVIVRANEDLEDLRVRVTPAFSAEPGDALPEIHASFLGYVPIRHGTTQTEEHDLVAIAPVDLPDPLLDLETINVMANENQAIWFTVYIPKACNPGIYNYEIIISANAHSLSIPMEIGVSPVILPDDRNLYVSQWISISAIQVAYGIEPMSEHFWALLQKKAAFLASYRQNVTCVPLTDLVRVTHTGENYQFDFTNFDRWVEIFENAGAADRIEGSHLVTRDAWEAPTFRGHSFPVFNTDGNPRWRDFPDAHGPEYMNFMEEFLVALQQHLEERGWLDRYLQHVADEPIEESMDSYLDLLKHTKYSAPKIKTTDSTIHPNAFPVLDVPVVVLDHVDANQTTVFNALDEGREVWFYTCLNPRGAYLNRMIDFHLIRTRLLHWLGFHYNIPGYVHWAASFWPENPWEQVENFELQPPLPPGDTHIMYPRGEGFASSIRLEAMRDGIEDYELLKLLEQRDALAAKELAASMVTSGSKYVRDPAEFRKARQELVRRLEGHSD